jgi:hypothetical protein
MPGKNHRRSRGLDQSSAKRSRLFRQPLRRRALIAVVGLLLPLSAMGALMARRSFAPPKSSSASAPAGKPASSAQISPQSAPASVYISPSPSFCGSVSRRAAKTQSSQEIRTSGLASAGFGNRARSSHLYQPAYINLRLLPVGRFPLSSPVPDLRRPLLE